MKVEKAKFLVVASTLIIGANSHSELVKNESVIAIDKMDLSKHYLVTYPIDSREYVYSALKTQFLEVKKIDHIIDTKVLKTEDSFQLEQVVKELTGLGINIKVVPYDEMQLSIQGRGGDGY